MSRLGPLIDIDSDRLWCCLVVKGGGKEDHHGIKIWKEPYGGSRGEGVGVLDTVGEADVCAFFGVAIDVVLMCSSNFMCLLLKGSNKPLQL